MERDSRTMERVRQHGNVPPQEERKE